MKSLIKNVSPNTAQISAGTVIAERENYFYRNWAYTGPNFKNNNFSFNIYYLNVVTYNVWGILCAAASFISQTERIAPCNLRKNTPTICATYGNICYCIQKVHIHIKDSCRIHLFFVIPNLYKLN